MAGISPAMTDADSVALELHGRFERIVADLKLMMLAAVRTADVERNEVQAAFARWVRLRAFDSGIDLLPSRWTREYQSAHDRPFRNSPTTRPDFHLTVINIW
jgi:hypothetical protein